MNIWNQAGCLMCRSQWLSGHFPPQIALNRLAHATLHRCKDCNTLWQQEERSAYPVSLSQAAATFPEWPEAEVTHASI